MIATMKKVKAQENMVIPLHEQRVHRLKGYAARPKPFTIEQKNRDFMRDSRLARELACRSGLALHEHWAGQPLPCTFIVNFYT